MSDRPKQITSQELLDSLLLFVSQKFYDGDPRGFAQDRDRLLKWVILWPAGWLNKRGVTLPGDRYKQILTDIWLLALRMGNTGRIKYRPAWLKMVVQSHFKAHGDEYYAEAKSARSLMENAVLVAGKAAVAPAHADPVSDLARAASLLKTKKRAPKAPLNQQLNLV